MPRKVEEEEFGTVSGWINEDNMEKSVLQSELDVLRIFFCSLPCEELVELTGTEAGSVIVINVSRSLFTKIVYSNISLCVLSFASSYWWLFNKHCSSFHAQSKKFKHCQNFVVRCLWSQ